MAYKIYKGSTELKKLYVGNKQVKKVYKGSTLIYNAFEAPKIDQPWFTSNTTGGFLLDDDSHRDNIYVLFNGTSNYGVVRRTWKDKWVSIKYPQQVVLDKYIITNENGGAFNQEPLEWRIEGSNNGTNWVQVDYRNVDRHVTGTVTTYTVTMPEETKYQWYRIYFLNGVIRDTYGLLRRIQFFTKAVG